MKPIEFTIEDINNLKVFLDRVELTGKEVPPFNSIVFKINQKIQELQKEENR